MKNNNNNMIIYKKLDENTNTLVFSDNFSGPFDDNIIWNIYKFKKIYFGRYLNCSIDLLKKLELLYGKKKLSKYPKILLTNPEYIFLTHIYFGDFFNKPVDEILPDTILLLKFGYHFSQRVENLPPHLQSLTFGCKFNQPVYSLPLGLKELVFNEHFNQPVNCLPEYLETLTFGMLFNQPVNCLPPNLKYLNFGFSFNQPIDNLPLGIKTLVLSNKFDHPVDMIPSSIELLELPKKYSHSLENLPSSIKEVKCGSDIFARKNFGSLQGILQNSHIKLSLGNKML